METKIFIYGLYENESGLIRYVGKTTNLKRRLTQHINKSKENKTHKDKWIQKNIKNNKKISIKLLEEVTNISWQEREIFWIEKHELKNLTNHSKGGDGGKIRNDWMNFEKAREIVWKLNLSSIKSWNGNKKNNDKILNNIPSNPSVTYKGHGWINWGNWLGTNFISCQKRNYLSYEEAKKFVHKLKIKNTSEWFDYCKTGKKPDNIPKDAYKAYKNKGWNSYSDWLNIPYMNKAKLLSYNEAKKHIKQFNIKSETQWRKFCKTKRTNIIPSNPNKTYKNNGWLSWGDFLSTNTINNKDKIKITFLEAQNIAQKNNINSISQWNSFVLLQGNEFGLPKNPSVVYKNHGWINWIHFLNKKGVV